MPRPLRPEDLLSCSASLRGLARGILHDEHLAEDAVQDAMLAAATQPPRDEGALGGWVRRVTQRFALRTRERDQGRALRERGAARPEAQPSAEDLARSLESRRELIDAVLALDEPYRSMVILRYFEGLGPADIAARRGIPASTVRVRLVRGLKLLRKKLESRFGPEGLHGALVTIAGLPIKSTACGAAAATAGVASTGSVAALLAPLTGVLAMKFKLAVAAILMLVLATVMLWEAGADRGGGDPMDSVAFGDQPVVQGTSPAAGETSIAMDAFAERGHQDVPAEGGVLAAAIELRGGVIDERRLPVEGATVRLLLDGREIQVATTEASGSFRFLLDASRRDDAPACRVHAADDAGRTALGRGSRVVPGDSGAREFDLLRLGPACDLDVRLVESGRTVTGADVVLELGGVFLRAVSDAEGLVRCRLVPPGDGTIRAWTASHFGEQQVELPLASGNAIEVELKPTCTAELTVVDRATGAPVHGAAVDVRSVVRTQDGTSSVRHSVPFDAASPTDEMGRTTLRLVSGADHAVHVRHPGHHMPRNPLVGPFLLVPAGSRQVRLALEPDPTIRFRILPGEVPPPPDGTRLRLVDLSRPPKQRFNGTARIEGPDLVVEGYDQDRARPYAQAPDGSLAELITAEGMIEHKTSFRRPRSVEVVVKSRDGKPLAGFPVALRPLSVSWLE